jgi:ATPase subunit of ABC transporter with duplicated ATPase domains
MKELDANEKIKVLLAQALFGKPDVLLLDEPTNHLDIYAIQWLEEFLEKEYKGSLVLITHDIALQQRVTDCLAVIHGARLLSKLRSKN